MSDQDPALIEADERPIAVRSFKGRGRGVVAVQDIPPHALLERCPVIIIPSKDRELVDRTIVFTYVYMWEHGTTEQDLYEHEGRAAIALGLSSLLNHAAQPNARFIRHIDELELELRSTRRIREGEEVTIDYQMDLWFEADSA